MLGAGESPPATFWRAFFVSAVLTTASFAAAPAGPAPELAQVGKPDAAEAARILEQFRRSGVLGQYYLEFELRVLPRAGEEQVFNGRMWGGRNDDGPVTRVELTDAAGGRHRLLVQNGEKPAVWRLAGGKVSSLGAGELFAAVIPGVEVTAFDLQRPFLYWPDATLESIRRVLGRPAYAFLFRAPPGFDPAAAEIAAARAYFDTQFNQPLQTELLDRSGKVLKTFSIVSLKTIDQQTLPKAVDFRNEGTRDKTRLQLTGATLGVELPPAIFDPGKLGEDVRPPDAGRITRIEP